MIRLPEIPQLQPTQIGYRKSSTEGLLVNSAQAARSAALPGLELTNLANAIGEVSDVYWSHLGEIQKGEDNRTTNTGKRDLAVAYSKHGESLQQDFDPTSRISKTRQFFENYKKNINFDNVSRKSQAEILEYFEDTAAQGMISQTEESMKMGVKESLLSSETAAKVFLQNNNLPGAVAVVRDQPNMSPAEKEEAIFKMESEFKLRQHSVAAFNDPSLWLSENPDAATAGVPEYEFIDLKTKAERYLSEQINESTDKAYDEISASWAANRDDPDKKGMTGKEATERYKGLPANTVRTLGGFADKLADGAFQLERTTDKFIETTTGQITALIDQYEPDKAVLPGINSEADAAAKLNRAAQRLEILDRLNLLFPSPIKDHLRSLLDEKEAMVAHDLNTNLDWVLKDLDTLDKQGAFGRLPAPKPMQMDQVLRSKFLKDEKKLKSLGISELDAKAIATEPTITKQVTAFQEAYRRRGQMVGADDLTMATANAIRDGSSDIAYIPPVEKNVFFAADEAANARVGKYMKQLFHLSKNDNAISYEKLKEALDNMVATDDRAAQTR